MEAPELKPFCLDSGLVNYYPVPRKLLLMDLPATAVLLYAVLLDRATLSRKNRFADEQGQVFVIYPIEKLAQTLSVSETAVKRHLKTLEALGLIRRTRPKRNGPNRIFLYLPAGNGSASVTEQKRPSQGAKSDCPTGRRVTGNNRRKPLDLNDFYQREEGESL